MGTLYDVEGFNVVHTTLDDELSNVRPEHKAKVGTNLVAAFGCYSVIIEQADVDQMASLQVKPTTMMKPGAYVFVLEDFIKTLTPQERAAIVYHEIGHLVNDHLVNVNSENVETETKILVNTEAELEADQYSVDRVGKAVMKSALEKVITNGTDVIEKLAAKKGIPFDKGAFLAAVYAEDQLRVRFAALS